MLPAPGCKHARVACATRVHTPTTFTNAGALRTCPVTAIVTERQRPLGKGKRWRGFGRRRPNGRQPVHRTRAAQPRLDPLLGTARAGRGHRECGCGGRLDSHRHRRHGRGTTDDTDPGKRPGPRPRRPSNNCCGVCCWRWEAHSRSSQSAYCSAGSPLRPAEQRDAIAGATAACPPAVIHAAWGPAPPVVADHVRDLETTSSPWQAHAA